MKRKQLWLTLFFITGVAFMASSQTASKATTSTKQATTKASTVVGKWQGTYEGSASGKCELEFTQDGTGKTTGQIAIQPDGGEKSPFFPFDAVTLEGNNLKASFKDPDGDSIEMEGKLENNQLRGNWKSASNDGGSWRTEKANK